MALKTAEEYVERLRKMKPNVYAHGKKMGRDDPILRVQKRYCQISGRY
jgi:aromatic ring hydroxylase